METRKESLTSLKQCRFCLSQNGLCSLYGKGTAKKSVPLALKILSNVSIEVMPSDKMPTYICNRCKFFMEVCYEFKHICREADQSIFQFIQEGTALEPIVWPQSLVKFFRNGAKPSEKGVVKTVVEGGTTVEVTSQDGSESEEGNEDVYNVKIEDGSVEGASACVKVVTKEVKDKKPKKAPRDPSSDCTESEPADGESKKPAKPGCWACDECDCTYPLQQLLELHKMQKHKNRPVVYVQCHDGKYVSKNSMSWNQNQQSSQETSFECVACGTRFRRPSLLRRHERLRHPELLKHKCTKCPASFLSREEFDLHKESHHRYADRAFTCGDCGKKFQEKSFLQRHKDTVHASNPSLSCEYCPEQFSSLSKLARHVRTHAGDRPYPCKFCDKSFTKSHHYTRHLRMQHNEQRALMRGKGPGGGGGGSKEAHYHCDQCAASFASQDELIYHSAIHATQNLTCPLCQEKFLDVDAVTAHIKSHVTGMEFMCGLCELVFTSQDKLDLHIITAHEDELRQQELTNDESSGDMDEDDYVMDDLVNIKREGNNMVVEIKKPDEFMITQDALYEENVKSEESEPEMLPEMPQPIVRQPPVKVPEKVTSSPVTVIAQRAGASPMLTVAPLTVSDAKDNNVQNSAATFVRKAEEIRRKTEVRRQVAATESSAPKQKVESSGGASDKSLRLLEKELQELQRTNTRNEVVKTPAKSMESLRNRRPQMHTSTPKLRSNDDRKLQISSKSTPAEKKIPERRGVKENKKPEESKEKLINVSAKEDKDGKSKNEDSKSKTEESKGKEDSKNRTEDSKGKEDSKNRNEDSKNKEEKEAKAVSKEETKDKDVIKNGTNNKSTPEEGVRRSSRASKVKDYAKMIRDRLETDSDKDDDTDDDDEEYNSKDYEKDKTSEAQNKSVGRPATARRSFGRPKAAAAKTAPNTPADNASPAAPVRKRGRPRKGTAPEVPEKLRKEESDLEDSKNETKADEKTDSEESKAEDKPVEEQTKTSSDIPVATENVEKPANVMMPPIAQTLKKVPIKALPPGVKPLPLPMNARPMGPGELCEMQIGKKVVKVQKIVMTKAEVEAMAKKGLVEMKDGTMVLKQGIKIPTSDPVAIKSSLVGDESPRKTEKAVPSRCELGDA